MTDPCQENSNGQGLTGLVERFSKEFQSGRIKSVIEFLQGIESNIHLHWVSQLVVKEIEFRRNRGESIEFSDFFDAIPELAELENEQTITQNEVNETTAAVTEYVEPESRKNNKKKLITTGDTIDDFDLLVELGSGSFATVFLARQNSMQRLVALKISSDHGMEAQTLAQLDHPHIVRVFDQRREREFGMQLLYMQYLEGGTLLDVLRRVINFPENQLNGRLIVQCVDDAVVDRGSSPNYESSTRNSLLDSNWEQAICRIGYQLANALEYAHQKGVLHRDIKPANVLIGSDCGVKLADFNISAAESVIGEFQFGGSLAYMSPEQIRAFDKDDQTSPNELTAHSDIYSLGVMLFHLLRRELPFSAVSKPHSSSGLATMVAEREQSIERIKSSLNDHSPLISNALVRCLQPNKDNRPESARDLANQLKIGLYPETEEFLFPGKRNWTMVFQRHFYLVCVFVVIVFNALAAVFVFNFNLFDAVPEKSHAIFWNTQAVINGVAFPLAIVLFLWLTLMVPKTLKACQSNMPTNSRDLKLAVDRTITSGHIQAVICGSLWLIAGFLYPISLTAFGCELGVSDWMDFIASHALAGISITALTFFVTTYLALKIWLPVLIQNSFASENVRSVSSGLDKLIGKIPVYQLLAVAVPLLAMTLLVIFGEVMTRSKFPLTVISIFGFVTIPIVLFGGNKVRSICERLLIAFRDD